MSNVYSINQASSRNLTHLFIGLICTLFLLIASFTLTNMMAPYVVADLGGSNEISTYTISLFGLGNAISVPLGEALAARVGTSKFFVSCLILFAFFTLACGFAPNFPVFLTYRFLQGLVSGPFYALIHFVFLVTPKEKKSTLTAIIVTLFAVVPVLGACWGGWIAYDFHWRWAFYFNVPLILLLTGFIWMHLKEYEFARPETTFDGVGYFFFFIGLFCLSFIVIAGQQLDWFRSSLISTLALIGVPCFSFFVLWSLYYPNPIVNLRLLKNKALTFALFNLVFLFSAYFGMVILLALWLTLDVNYTPIWVGLLIGTMAIAGLFPSFLVKERFHLQLIDTRIPLAIAIVFFAVSSFHTATFDVEIDFGRIAISRFLAGFGLAFFLSPLFRLCFRSFKEEEGLSVLTIFQVVRALASSLGVAVYMTVWQRRQVFYHDRMGGDLTISSSETQEFFNNAKEFQLHGVSAAEQLNVFLNRRATSLALDDVFYLMAWVMVGLFALICLTLFFRTKIFVPEKNIGG